MAPKVALILGAGPRIGAQAAAKFAGAGYSVVVASRSAKGGKTPEGYLSVPVDLTDPSAVPAVFKTVSSELGSAPSVVIYNTGRLTFPPDENDVLSIPVDDFAKDLATNTVSVYAAAQEAVKGFDSLKVGGKFMYTGNGLNKTAVPVPFMLDVGVGKSATAYFIQVADALYAAKGHRFFYVDERKADGAFAGEALDGAANGDFFLQLAEGDSKDIPSLATFVKDKGYVKF